MAKTKPSAIRGKLGGAFRKHANDETDYGQDFTALPGGIVGGVAQLVSAKIDVYKKGNNVGERFLRLAGTVIEPDEVTVVKKTFANGKVETLPPQTMRIAGLQTSIMLPLCETKNSKGEVTTVDENAEAALNELRKLGADTSTMDQEFGDDTEAITALEEICQALVEAGPFFRFSTSESEPTAQYPTPRVWENWRGNRGLEDYVAPDGDSVVETEEAPSEEPAEEQEQEAEEPAEEEGEDLQALGKAADKGDEEAAARLTELAEAAGIDPNELEKWVDVANALTEQGEEPTEEEPQEEEPEAAAPKKGDVYKFKPKGARKLVECEVTAVFERNQTVNLKNLDDGKTTYKGIGWDDLVEA